MHTVYLNASITIGQPYAIITACQSKMFKYILQSNCWTIYRLLKCPNPSADRTDTMKLSTHSLQGEVQKPTTHNSGVTNWESKQCLNFVKCVNNWNGEMPWSRHIVTSETNHPKKNTRSP